MFEFFGDGVEVHEAEALLEVACEEFAVCFCEPADEYDVEFVVLVDYVFSASGSGQQLLLEFLLLLQTAQCYCAHAEL